MMLFHIFICPCVYVILLRCLRNWILWEKKEEIYFDFFIKWGKGLLKIFGIKSVLKLVWNGFYERRRHVPSPLCAPLMWLL